MIKNSMYIKFCLCCSDCKTKRRQQLQIMSPFHPIPPCPTGLSTAKKQRISASLFSRLSLLSLRQSLHSYHRNYVNQVKLKFVVRVFLTFWAPSPYAGGGFTLKTHQMFSVHTTPEEFKNATITGHFGFD